MQKSGTLTIILGLQKFNNQAKFMSELNEIISFEVITPFLNGINVSEEQQELPGAVLLPVREQQVVARDAQRPSARRPLALSQHHVLHVGRLNVLRKLHGTALASSTELSPTSKSLPRVLRKRKRASS